MVQRLIKRTSTGSGLWMPEASKLALIRQNIDRNSQQLKDILMHPDVRREILGGVPNDEKKVIKAFFNQNKESALKTRPKVGKFYSRPFINIFSPGLKSPATYTNHRCHSKVLSFQRPIHFPTSRTKREVS